MPRVKPEDRQRARRPKVRTGCRTCKIRRVKCDEAKPNCLRCTSTGRKCDGYEPMSICEPLPITQNVGYWNAFGTHQELRALQFFHERTSLQLSGFYECAFWKRIIQASHLDLGIRHAVVALGSLHEDFERTGEAERTQDNFALNHYNSAIQLNLQNLIDRKPKSIDNYVASCMIFISIEILQGHYQSALSLITGAVKLFYESSEHSRSESEWPVETLESMLSRLQAQAVGLVGLSAFPETIPPRTLNNPVIPEKFSSILEAKDYFEFYSHSHALSGRATELSQYKPDGSCSFSFYIHIFNRWSSAFEALLAELGENISEGLRAAVNVLKIWQLMMASPIDIALNRRSTMESSDNPEDQTIWDDYQDNHEKVVDLADSLVKHLKVRFGQSPQMTHLFTLNFRIVGPLYDTARICRDPIIRRKAIRLLRAYPCREGLWDSLLAARAAERQMEIEESAVDHVAKASDIPAKARITSIFPEFQPGERRAVLKLIGQKSNVPGEEPVCYEEVIEW